MSQTSKGPLEVAIVGAGVTGLALAVGLLKRNVNFTIYERADQFNELGVGITFSPNAERAMERLDPRVLQSFIDVATNAAGGTLSCMDGVHEQGDDATASVQELLFKIHIKEGYKACRRCDFVDQLAQLIPEENTRFGKWLDSVETEKESGKAILTFRDGEKAKADVVIGCDGVYSRVRSSMFGSGPSSPRPQYSHQLAYRAVVPMEKAVAAVGQEKSSSVLVHLGPTGFLFSVPLLSINAMHIDAFVLDENDWPDSKAENSNKRSVRPATLKDARDAYAGYGPTVQAFLSLLPENLDKWAIFDMYDTPVPTYAQGCVCLAGDSAHASTPNHGGGAGVGIEDALVVAQVLAALASRSSFNNSVISEALQVYNDVRYERSQWLVQSSRRTGKLFTWQASEYGPFGTNIEAVGREIVNRSRQVWDYDTDGMVANTNQLLGKRLGQL